MATTYIIPTKVAEVLHKRTVRSTRRDPAFPNDASKVIEITEDGGWYVRCEGSWEASFVGMEEPDLKVGQPVEIVIRPRA